MATYASLNSAPMVAVRGYANEISVRGMALQLDGVPLNNFSYSTSAYDLPFLSPDLLGGLEMIRGPGSTLYGSDAFHGVLALSTRRQDGDSGRQRLQAGSAGDVVYSAHAGRALEAGELQGGLSLTRHGDRELAYGYRDYRSGAPRGVSGRTGWRMPRLFALDTRTGRGPRRRVASEPVCRRVPQRRLSRYRRPVLPPATGRGWRCKA